jgi:hypothetical protein
VKPFSAAFFVFGGALGQLLGYYQLALLDSYFRAYNFSTGNTFSTIVEFHVTKNADPRRHEALVDTSIRILSVLSEAEDTILRHHARTHRRRFNCQF